MTYAEFKELALSFDHTKDAPHFDRTAFRIVNKRIFATLHENSGTANMRLPLPDQNVFCEYDQSRIYPVPNKWGRQGWTTFEIALVPNELISAALHTAYRYALGK